MAKKNRQRLQALIKKRQKLSQIEQGKIEQQPKPQITKLKSVKAQPEKPQLIPKSHPGVVIAKELRRTLVSVVIIALLLSGSLIVDHKTNTLKNFGDQLYQGLRLNK